MNIEISLSKNRNKVGQSYFPQKKMFKDFIFLNNWKKFKYCESLNYYSYKGSKNNQDKFNGSIKNNILLHKEFLSKRQQDILDDLNIYSYLEFFDLEKIMSNTIKSWVYHSYNYNDDNYIKYYGSNANFFTEFNNVIILSNAHLYIKISIKSLLLIDREESIIKNTKRCVVDVDYNYFDNKEKDLLLVKIITQIVINSMSSRMYVNFIHKYDDIVEINFKNIKGGNKHVRFN